MRHQTHAQVSQSGVSHDASILDTSYPGFSGEFRDSTLIVGDVILIKLEGSVPPLHIRAGCCGPALSSSRWGIIRLLLLAVESAFGVTKAPTTMGLARDEEEEVVPCLAPSPPPTPTFAPPFPSESQS